MTIRNRWGVGAATVVIGAEGASVGAALGVCAIVPDVTFAGGAITGFVTVIVLPPAEKLAISAVWPLTVSSAPPLFSTNVTALMPWSSNFHSRALAAMTGSR